MLIEGSINVSALPTGCLDRRRQTSREGPWSNSRAQRFRASGTVSSVRASRHPGRGSTATSRRGGSTPATATTATPLDGQFAVGRRHPGRPSRAVDPCARRGPAVQRGRRAPRHGRVASARAARRAAGAERALERAAEPDRQPRPARRRADASGPGRCSSAAGARCRGRGSSHRSSPSWSPPSWWRPCREIHTYRRFGRFKEAVLRAERATRRDRSRASDEAAASARSSTACRARRSRSPC